MGRPSWRHLSREAYTGGKEFSDAPFLALLLTLAPLAGPGALETPVYQVEKVAYAPYLEPGKLTVVASFDGSYLLDRWQSVLAFAQANGVKFTFFVSGVYFLPDQSRDQYVDPMDPRKTGKSDIGFGGTAQEVEARKAFVLRALTEGHDVQSHLNGHFNGTRWISDEWKREFEEFNGLLSFLPDPALHVRFPLLAMNPQAYPAMAELGLKSITSTLSPDFLEFRRVTIDRAGTPYTIVEFPISKEHEQGSLLLLMDYNFYLYDQQHHIDPEKAKADMIALYLDEAQKCLAEKRPFFINHHFSNWNHAAYWEAMKTVIETINQKYDVRYLTISELYRRVSTAGPLP